MGAKMVTMLAVRGPSHAPLLDDAAKEFLKLLTGKHWAVWLLKSIPMRWASCTSRIATYALCLHSRCVQRVLWHSCTEHMIANGVKSFVEVGPSNVLSRCSGDAWTRKRRSFR